MRYRYSDVDPRTLGRPGGPCQVIQNIDESNLPEDVKEDLIQDVNQGKDLDNRDIAPVYGRDVIRLGGQLFPSVLITNHAKYRMDLRGVTLDNVKEAFAEFEKWYDYRKRNRNKLTAKDIESLKGLLNGDSIKFEARVGITLAFIIGRGEVAVLRSAWQTGTNPPKKPRPGECQLKNSFDMKSIVEGLKRATLILK